MRKVESPYAELKTYQSEMNNGGHYSYYSNVENVGDLPKEILRLAIILAPDLKMNL